MNKLIEKIKAWSRRTNAYDAYAAFILFVLIGLVIFIVTVS